MKYNEGKILELGENRMKYAILETVKDEQNKGEVLVVAPMEGDINSPIIHNDKPVFLRNTREGLEIITDKDEISAILRII